MGKEGGGGVGVDKYIYCAYFIKILSFRTFSQVLKHIAHQYSSSIIVHTVDFSSKPYTKIPTR